MKAIILALVMLMAGDFEKTDEPASPPNSPLQEAKQEGLKQEKYLHLLLKRVSSGDINTETAACIEEKGEGDSPKQLLAVNGKITPPQKIYRRKSRFNLSDLPLQAQDKDEEGNPGSIG